LTSVNLTPENGKTIYISEGLAHGVMALTEGAAVSYLLSSEFSPANEHGVNPFDVNLDINWPLKYSQISEKDIYSKSISEMQESNLLPIWDS
jgi:dTDP-4-dehydrorhamnose 3,5-epimerase